MSPPRRLRVFSLAWLIAAEADSSKIVKMFIVLYCVLSSKFFSALLLPCLLNFDPPLFNNYPPMYTKESRW